jgi:hypothetical protein
MPSATPTEGRLDEATSVKVVYTGGYATGASRGTFREQPISIWMPAIPAANRAGRHTAIGDS